jgi:hypothetical protein
MITSLGLLVYPHSSSYAAYTNTIGNKRTCFLCPIDGDYKTTRKIFRKKINQSFQQQRAAEKEVLNCLDDASDLVGWFMGLRRVVHTQPTFYQWNSLSEEFTSHKVNTQRLAEFEKNWDALFDNVYSLILNPRGLVRNSLYSDEPTNSVNLKANLERYLQHFSKEQINLSSLIVDPYSGSFSISIRNLTTSRIAIIDLPHILSNPFFLLESSGASLQSYMQNF